MHKTLVMAVIAAYCTLVWTGCESSQPKGRTNSGPSNTSPGITKARNMPEDKKYRIAIEDFEVQMQNVQLPNAGGQDASQIARALTNKFENYVLNSDCFIVTGSNTSGDRNYSKSEIAEGSSDYYNQDTAAEFGKMEAPQFIMRGALVSMHVQDQGAIGGGNKHFAVGVGGTRYEVRVSCRVFDVAKNRIVFSSEGVGEKDDTTLIAGGGDQNFFVGGVIAENTPMQEVVDAAVGALVEDIVDRLYR